MKKFYTMMAMASVAFAASAVMVPNVNPIQGSGLTPEGKQILSTRMACAQQRIQAGSIDDSDLLYTRSWTDAQGEEWFVTIANDGTPWVKMMDLETTSGPITELYQFPYFVVFYYLQNETGDIYMVMPLFWPAKAVLFDDPDTAPEDMDLSISSINDLIDVEYPRFQICQYGTNGGWMPGAQFDSNGNLEGWGIYPAAPGYGSCLVNNNAVYLIFSEDSNGARQSTITFEAFDPTTFEAEISHRLYINNIDQNLNSLGTGLKTIRQTPFQGDIWTVGFEYRFVQEEWNDVHIFFGGETSSKTDFNYADKDYNDWGPVSQFFIAAVNDKFNVSWVKGNKFDASKIGLDEVTANQPASAYTYAMGAFYGEASEGPVPNTVTEFVLQPLDYEYTNQEQTDYELYNVPAVGTMMPYNGERLGFKSDGFFFAYQGHGFSPMSVSTEVNRDNTYIRLFTKDGVVMHVRSDYGDEALFTYKGDITLHIDPTNMDVVETIAAVGENPGTDSVKEILVGNNVFVQNGSIVAPEGARVFDMSGRQVAGSNLAKGIYVVVAGKNAVKVLVK